MSGKILYNKMLKAKVLIQGYIKANPPFFTSVKYQFFYHIHYVYCDSTLDTSDLSVENYSPYLDLPIGFFVGFVIVSSSIL